MSFKVLVVPEDPTNNGYILKPLVEVILSDAGKSRTKVQVLTSPRLNGYDDAVKAINGELFDRYGHWDLWIFIPDADRASKAAMTAMEEKLAAKGVKLLCCAAQPEVEIFACVAYRSELGAHWSEVRSSGKMKELFFDPLLSAKGDSRRAGGGRDQLISASITPLSTLYTFCPELSELRKRVIQLFP